MRRRLRATLGIHVAVFRVLLPVITAYVSALKAVWLHRAAVDPPEQEESWADAMRSKPEHYTPYPEREQENWAKPYPPWLTDRERADRSPGTRRDAPRRVPGQSSCEGHYVPDA